MMSALGHRLMRCAYLLAWAASGHVRRIGRWSTLGSARSQSDPVAGILAFALYSLLVLSPEFVTPFALGHDAAGDIGNTHPLQILGYSLALWLIWVSLWRRAFWPCLLAAPFLLAAPVEIYLLTQYHTLLLPHVFGIIRDTNLAEAREFLRGLWVLGTVAYLGILAGAAVCLRVLWASQYGFATRFRIGVILIFASVIGGLQLLYSRQEAWANDFHAAPNELRVEGLPLVVTALRDTFPFGLVLRYAYYREAADKLARAREKAAAFRFGAGQILGSDVRQAFVLVIGESARFDRWSLNGYARQTNPRLATETNLVSFSDVVSVATATRFSVPILLSRKPAALVAQFTFPERSVLSAFREAGFETFWLSNQVSVSNVDSPIAVLAQEADHRRYFNPGDFSHATPYDDVMLPVLAEILAQDQRSEFIVLHMLGSHFDYRQRYPDAFDVFRPSPSREAQVAYTDADHKEELNNAYDNSILYTDYFLSRAIAQLKASGRPVTALLYVSDHGEDLFDQQCRFSGHGRSTTAGFRVPMLFWYSDGYAQRLAGKVEALRRNRMARMTTENVFPTLVDGAGIRFPSQDLTRSAASDSLREHRRLVASLSGSIDFDRARRNDNCELIN